MITKEAIISRRLDNQQIGASGTGGPEDLVSWLGCIQAQDFAGAKWAIGSRLVGQTDGDIQRAFNEGRILRTHILRPTWHFVTPEDIGWMLTLTAPRIKAFCAGMHRQLELDETTFQRSHTILQKALSGGVQLTRKELLPVFRRAKIRTDELRLAQLLMQAELDGIICSGAMNGKQFTYALLEERAPVVKKMSQEEAVAELVLRYFRSRGPATLADFAWWSGLTVADGKKGVDACRSLLVNEVVDEQSYWVYSGPTASPSLAGPLSRACVTGLPSPDPAVLRALPAFDEYTVAYKDRDLVLSPKHALRSGNGIFKPILLREGKIVGTWQRTIKKDHIAVTADMFRPGGSRLLKTAFTRYEAFMEKSVVCQTDKDWD